MTEFESQRNLLADQMIPIFILLVFGATLSALGQGKSTTPRTGESDCLEDAYRRQVFGGISICLPRSIILESRKAVDSTIWGYKSEEMAVVVEFGSNTARAGSEAVGLPLRKLRIDGAPATVSYIEDAKADYKFVAWLSFDKTDNKKGTYSVSIYLANEFVRFGDSTEKWTDFADRIFCSTKLSD